jgi:hypothetical protein
MKSCIQFMSELKPNETGCLVPLNTTTVDSKWTNAWIFAELKNSCQHCVAPKSEKSAGRAYEFNGAECYVSNSVS